MKVDRKRRSSVLTGLLLIVLGLSVLILQLVPGVHLPFSWPWVIIGFGLLLLVVGGVTGVPALAVPATIVTGFGGILYYQNTTGDWDSWAYIWTLIPGFVGLGLILAGILAREGTEFLRAGGLLVFISLTLLALFGSVFGALGLLGTYWPVLLILLGLALLLLPLLGRHRRGW
mgnify:CR=1 FL=1